MPKTTKYSDYFSEPQWFGKDWGYCLSKEYSEKEARRIFAEYLGEEEDLLILSIDSVRYGFYFNDDIGSYMNCWNGPHYGKGSKEVWCCHV